MINYSKGTKRLSISGPLLTESCGRAQFELNSSRRVKQIEDVLVRPHDSLWHHKGLLVPGRQVILQEEEWDEQDHLPSTHTFDLAHIFLFQSVTRFWRSTSAFMENGASPYQTFYISWAAELHYIILCYVILYCVIFRILDLWTGTDCSGVTDLSLPSCLHNTNVCSFHGNAEWRK